MNETILREMRESDLPALFEIQSDPEGQRMAAFTRARGAQGEEIDEALFRLD